MSPSKKVKPESICNKSEDEQWVKIIWRKFNAKANNIREIVKKSSVLYINLLLTFKTGKIRKLDKKEYKILSKVGLLRNNGDKCSNCNKNRLMIK